MPQRATGKEREYGRKPKAGISTNLFHLGTVEHFSDAELDIKKNLPFCLNGTFVSFDYIRRESGRLYGVLLVRSTTECVD